MVVLPAVLHLHLPDGGPIRPPGEGHCLPLLQEGQHRHISATYDLFLSDF